MLNYFNMCLHEALIYLQTKRREVSGPVAELTGIQQGILDSLHNIEASLQQQAEQMERQANAMEVFVSCVKLHLGVETVVELEQ